METGWNSHEKQVKIILEMYTVNDVIYAFTEYMKETDTFNENELQDFVRDTPIQEIAGFLIEECERRGDDVLDILEQNRWPY